ncbi:MAG: hypothetical protein IKO72_01410 [Kiritimatiellae bacterium]|nr:hypothetical protein [Kiritimatiellia bacterium]
MKRLETGKMAWGSALLAAAWGAFASCAATLDVTRFGAKADGSTDSTAAIQKAIDECCASGGGRVLVPAGGVYKTYTLNLKNNVELHIDRGATLKSGEDPYKFPEFAPTDVWNVERSPRFNRRAMFYTVGQTNVAITGAGTIDGNAEAYHERVDGRWRRISHTNITGRCIFFVGCRDVRLDDVLIYHPCGWSTWFLDCDRVGCRGVRVECHREFPNGDGLHFGGCRDVVVSDCSIDAQDDALIVRTHQEQMRVSRPCERMVFANCILRSNQSAIRMGWTGDGPIRDVSFDNIVCTYSRLGVQFFLPPEPPPPGECVDPPRGRGLVPPPRSSRLPFSAENIRFSNMSIRSFEAPVFIDIGRTENVAFIRDVSFSHCRFKAQRPPVVNCRPEDGVSDWRFSDVVFEIAKPRGQPSGPRSDRYASCGWFENVGGVVLDNVKWTWLPQDTPEWSLILEQEGSSRRVLVQGARQSCRVDESRGGRKRYVYDSLTDGEKSWKIAVTLESTPVPGGVSWRGEVANKDPGMRVTEFEGPFCDGIRVDPSEATLYVPEGMGRRLRFFPTERQFSSLAPLKGWHAPSFWRSTGDGRAAISTPTYPSSLFTMPWVAFDTGFGTRYAGVHDPAAAAKRAQVRWSPRENSAAIAFKHFISLPSGGAWKIPETVFSEEDGGWHAAARRYRAWYDSVHSMRAAAPDWTRDLTGWLLVIMKQQNEELMWPYTDIPKLCDAAERRGLNCIGLFGWTVGGHDHLYPDYDADPKMGGAEALKAGIAEARRRGIRVCIYANGQLQQVGATKFWEEHGRRLAIRNRDGSPVIQTYHKFKDIPKYEFALGCLRGQPWHDRMLSLARQASGFGADAIIYDQLGMFAPFECWGEGHGHPTPCYTYGVERPGFLRSIADAIHNENPGFAVFTEGLHDTVLDSVAFFHGCVYGTFPAETASVRARASGKKEKSDAFPELSRYTFPEVLSTIRFSTPMDTRSLVNYAAVMGLRHEIEVRYAPDRRYLLEDRVPAREDYGTVNHLPSLADMRSVPPAEASAYLKAMCDFQRVHAKHMMRGRFVDDEGFTCADAGLVAKRFVAEDGTSAVCVWNIGEKHAEVKIDGLGAQTGVFAPGGEPTEGPLAPDSIRLYTFKKDTP